MNLASDTVSGLRCEFDRHRGSHRDAHPYGQRSSRHFDGCDHWRLGDHFAAAHDGTPLAPACCLSSGTFLQVQRMGNPLINELLIGTGFKDRFSMDQPKNDAQFASFFLDPALARVVNALTAGAVAIPTPPRTRSAPGGDLRAADRRRRNSRRSGCGSAAAQYRCRAHAAGSAQPSRSARR